MSGFILLDGLRSRIIRSMPSTIRRLRAASTSSCDSDDLSSYMTATNSGASTPTGVTDKGLLALTAINQAVTKMPSTQLTHNRELACSEGAIDWATVELGVHLSQYALECHRANAGTDPALLRNVLEDSMKYIRTGLSQDQSTELNLESRSGLCDRRSFVRSCTASLVCCMIGFFMIALPIMASLVSWAFEFERRHQLTERAASQAVNTAGSASLQLGNLLVKVNQSEVGNQAAHLLQDILEGARDGVNDYTSKVRSTNENLLRENAVL